jgi:hypothetical protein
MRESQSSRHIARSIGAILAGFAFVIILSLGTDEVLHIARVFPPWGASMIGFDGALLLATAYRILFGIAGSYVTARLAPDRPMQHAMVGGVVGFALSIAGGVATWNKGPAFGPHWYPLALIVTALPTAWAGGKLRLIQLRSRAQFREQQPSSVARPAGR